MGAGGDIWVLKRTVCLSPSGGRVTARTNISMVKTTATGINLRWTSLTTQEMSSAPDAPASMVRRSAALISCVVNSSSNDLSVECVRSLHHHSHRMAGIATPTGCPNTNQYDCFLSSSVENSGSIHALRSPTHCYHAINLIRIELARPMLNKRLSDPLWYGQRFYSAIAGTARIEEA